MASRPIGEVSILGSLGKLPEGVERPVFKITRVGHVIDNMAQKTKVNSHECVQCLDLLIASGVTFCPGVKLVKFSAQVY